MTRSSGYPFVAKLMRGLGIGHWVTAVVLLGWFSPIGFSFGALLDSWQLIGTATFFLILGTRYWITATWAETKGEQHERIRHSIRRFSKSLP